MHCGQFIIYRTLGLSQHSFRPLEICPLNPYRRYFSSKELFGDISFPILSPNSWRLPCNKVLKMGQSQYLIPKTTVVCTSLENHPKKSARGTQQNETTNKAQWKLPTKISKSKFSWICQRQSGLTLPMETTRILTALATIGPSIIMTYYTYYSYSAFERTDSNII